MSEFLPNDQSESENDIERLAEAEIRLAHFQAEQIRYATTYCGYPEVPENNDLGTLGVSGLAKLHLNVVVMQHITRSRIDGFCRDLVNSLHLEHAMS